MFCFWLHIILNWYPFFIYVLISFEILFWRLGFSLIASKRHLKMLVMLMSWEMSLQCRWSLLLVSSGELWSSPVSYSWWGRARLLLETLHQEFISLQPVTQPSHPAQHSEQDIAQQLLHQQQQRSEHQQQSTTSTWEPWVERSSSKIFVMYVTFCILSINSIVNQCKMFCCDLSKIEFNENQNR